MSRGGAVATILALVLAACSGTESTEPELRATNSAPRESTTTAGPAEDKAETSTSATTASSNTTSTLPRPRTLQVTVAQEGADLTVTDAGGGYWDTQGGFEGVVVGEVEVHVELDGYEAETTTLAADTTNHVFWLDKSGQVLDKIAEFDTGNAPKQVAFRPGNNELWVTLLGGTGFVVHDPMTGEILSSTELPGGGSVEVIFNEAGTLAYVSQMETASVYEIDANTKEVLRQLDTQGAWTKVMELSPDEKTLWASNWTSNDVSEIDLETGEVIRKLNTVATPRGLYVTPDGAKLYVAGFANGEIQVFDLASGESSVIYRTEGAMRHLVGSPDGSIVYASDMARANVVAVNTATGEVTELSEVDRVPNTIDLSPDGQVLYVSNRGRNNFETYLIPGPEWGTVVVVDTATGAYLDAIVGGNQTTGLDVSPDGSLLAFSDFLDDRITVFSIPPYEVLIAGDGGRWEEHLTELVK